MMICSLDRVEDALDEVVWHVVVEEIAHGVHEYHSRRGPMQRCFKKVRLQRGTKLVSIAVLAHRMKSARHTLGVAELASRADLGAASDRVPSGVRPFDLR
jgi:hypothetical protein